MWNRIDFGDSISGDLGNGVFRYRGLRSRVNQRATFWQMWFFGGAEFGDTQQRGESVRCLFVATSDDPEWVAKRETLL
jgi:hypothetical protein